MVLGTNSRAYRLLYAANYSVLFSSVHATHVDRSEERFMPSSAKAKLYRALKSGEATIRSIVNSLSPSEAEEWNRIFQEHPIAGVPIGRYGLTALRPLTRYAASKVAAEPLQEMAEYIAEEVTSELASEFALWVADQIADAHFPGLSIARKMTYLTYKVAQVRSIFYNRSITDDVIIRVADATGVSKRVEEINNTVTNAVTDEIKRRFGNGDDGMFGGLVPV